jgi:hypothetical protein
MTKRRKLSPTEKSWIASHVGQPVRYAGLKRKPKLVRQRIAVAGTSTSLDPVFNQRQQCRDAQAKQQAMERIGSGNCG